MMSLALLVAFVHRRVLGTFFSLDDMVLFQRVHGVIPWPGTPWRWLSGVAWFRLVTPLWGEQPLPYHVANLLLHTLNAALLGLLARRWGASRVAAWLAAGLFAVSPLHFTTLLSASSIGELLALLFTLLALLALAHKRTAVAVVVPFALALLAKESVLLVPLAALAVATRGEGLRDRARRVAPLALLGAAVGAALLASGMFSGRLGGQAYAVAFGSNLIQNVARLASWSLWPRDPIPDLHAEMSGAGVLAWPLAAIGLTLVAALGPTRPPVRAGAAWWWLAALPVLPLVGRTYLHYLYTPLAGLALVAAGVFDSVAPQVLARVRGPLARRHGGWLIATLLLLTGAGLADHQLAARMAARMPSVDWPLDPVLRKSEIARRSITDVRDALAGRHANVVLLLLASVAETIDLGTGRGVRATLSGQYQLESVLDEGRSLRAFVPAVDSVEFVHDFVPGHGDFTFFFALSDGHVGEIGIPPRAHAIVVSTLLASGKVSAAREYADAALADRAREPGYLYMAACAHEAVGDHARGLEMLHELVRVAPADSFAWAARQILAGAPVHR